MMPATREYQVDLSLNGCPLSVPVLALTAGLAATAAEAMHPGSTATAVLCRQIVAGRCCRCRVLLFDGDVFRRRRPGLVCESC